MLQNNNLIEIVRNINEGVSFVVANRDTLDLGDLENFNGFLSECASVVNDMVEDKKVEIKEIEEEKEIKGYLHEEIDFYMRGLIESINRNDIYIEKSRSVIKYDIEVVEEHIEICKGLLVSIENYDSFCEEDENEFSDTVPFIEKYLYTLQTILEKEGNKNKDLSAMWSYVLGKNNLL